MQKSSISRSQHGFTVAAVVFAACLILLPVGLYSFDLARSNLARTQLKAALDASTLAAANTLANDSDSGGNSLATAKNVALIFMKRQMIMSGILEHTTLSATAETDNPAAGDCTFNITQDANLNIHSRAAYGLRPAFGAFLGITTQTIRASSGAGYTGLAGDIAIVLDISDSLTVLSKSLIVQRKYNKTTQTLTYREVRNAGRHPALGRLQARNGIPNPNDWKLDRSAKLKAALENQPRDFQVAFMIEAKKGNLASEAKFIESKANKGILNGKVAFDPEWQTEYQKVAVENVLRLAEEKNAIKTFINDYLGTSTDGHLALVTFGGRESGDTDFKDSFSTFSGHGYPHVNLNKNADNKQLVVDSISPALSRNGTDMKGGIAKATEILTGANHRDGMPQTMILLTDGLPTTGSPFPAAKAAGEKGIKIFAIGYFNPAPGLKAKGQRVLRKICAKAGNGSREFIPPDYPTLLDVLKRISQGDLALNNE